MAEFFSEKSCLLVLPRRSIAVACLAFSQPVHSAGLTVNFTVSLSLSWACAWAGGVSGSNCHTSRIMIPKGTHPTHWMSVCFGDVMFLCFFLMWLSIYAKNRGLPIPVL